MDVPFWVVTLVMGVGTLLALRACLLITVKSNGRFRGDPLVTITVGFALIFLGQFMHGR